VAVYEGARPGRHAIPRASDAVNLPRRRSRGAIRVRARRQSGRLGLLLGAIVVAFLLAFFSLAQTVRVSATGYDVSQLLDQRDRLTAQQQELLSDLNRLGREPAIRRQAIDLGLAPLAEPLILRAR
jgi:hypothetical protein